MSDDILKIRRQAMEQVFHQRDKALLEQLRATLDQDKMVAQQRARLSEVSGIRDEAVIDRLVQLNVAPETFAAMALIPLVRVAWADLRVQEPERDAILRAAEASGIAAGTPARQFLDRWLESPPTKELMQTWTAYVKALMANVSDEDRALFKASLVERARSVAAAAGGILGLGKPIAICEQVVLDELAAAFDH